MQGNIFQNTALIKRPRLPRNILTAAKNRILNIRRTVIANDILYQRFKTAITRGNTLRAHDCYFFHKINEIKKKLDYKFFMNLSPYQKQASTRAYNTDTKKSNISPRKFIFPRGTRPIAKFIFLSNSYNTDL